MSPRAEGVSFARDTDTDAAYVSTSAVPVEVARRALDELRRAGWTASYAPDNGDVRLAWVYAGWAGEPEPS